MNKEASQSYRPGIGIVLLNKEYQVFVGQRRDMKSTAWQMPQGGIDEGETPWEAWQRELLEEVGTDKVQYVTETKEWLTYDLPADLAAHFWGGRFRGQRQKWFLLEFTGEDNDINIETENPEFLAWKWAPLESVAGVIVPFKKALYERVVEEFSPIIKNLQKNASHV